MGGRAATKMELRVTKGGAGTTALPKLELALEGIEIVGDGIRTGGKVGVARAIPAEGFAKRNVDVEGNVPGLREIGVSIGKEGISGNIRGELGRGRV